MKEDIEEELINCNNHSIINITGTSTIEEDINIEENIIIEEIFIADEEEKTIVEKETFTTFVEEEEEDG